MIFLNSNQILFLLILKLLSIVINFCLLFVLRNGITSLGVQINYWLLLQINYVKQMKMQIFLALNLLLAKIVVCSLASHSPLPIGELNLTICCFYCCFRRTELHLT